MLAVLRCHIQMSYAHSPTERVDEAPRRVHRDPTPAVLRPHMVIARNDRTRTRRQSQCEQHVVVGIGGDRRAQRCRDDHGRACIHRREKRFHHRAPRRIPRPEFQTDPPILRQHRDRDHPFKPATISRLEDPVRQAAEEQAGHHDIRVEHDPHGRRRTLVIAF